MVSRKATNIVCWICFALIVLIIIADVVMYVTGKGIYTFKAKPAPTTVSSTKFLGMKVAPKAFTSVYYPNGEPDPTTGEPANSGTLASRFKTQINTNLGLYSTSASLHQPTEWGAAS